MVNTSVALTLQPGRLPGRDAWDSGNVFPGGGARRRRRGVDHNANRRGESDHDSPAGPGPHGYHGERRAITVTPAQARLGNWGMSVPAESATRIEPRGQTGQIGLGTAQPSRWLG